MRINIKETKFFVKLFQSNNNIQYDLIENKYIGTTEDMYIRYLKGKFRSYVNWVREYKNPRIPYTNQIVSEISNKTNREAAEYYRDLLFKWLDHLDAQVKIAEPLSYTEIMKLGEEYREFQLIAISSVNIPELIQNAGAKRIKTDGHVGEYDTYTKEGVFLGKQEISNVYEVYEIDSRKLGAERGGNVYAVKCWCTTTNKEHYIFIDEQFKNDPLAAVASLHHVYEDMIPHIKNIIRQGDVFLLEMDKEVIVEEGAPRRPLTKEEYFGLLRAQS